MGLLDGLKYGKAASELGLTVEQYKEFRQFEDSCGLSIEEYRQYLRKYAGQMSLQRYVDGVKKSAEKKNQSLADLQQKEKHIAQGAQPQFTIRYGVLERADIPENCTVLKIPEGVREIRKDALYFRGNSEQIRTLELPGTLKVIPNEVFLKFSMRELILSSGIERIEVGAFLGCENLQSVDFPASVNCIEGVAFNSCPQLRKITIRNPECEVDSTAFFQLEGDYVALNIPRKLEYVANDLRAFMKKVGVYFIDSEDSGASDSSKIIINVNRLANEVEPEEKTEENTRRRRRAGTMPMHSGVEEDVVRPSVRPDVTPVEKKPMYKATPKPYEKRIRQEGDKIIVDDLWTMELPYGCRLYVEENQSTAMPGWACAIQSGDGVVCDFGLSRDIAQQKLTAIADGVSFDVVAEGGVKMVDASLRDDEQMSVHLKLLFLGDGSSMVKLTVQICNHEDAYYVLKGSLPEIDDMEEAVQKVLDKDYAVHPFGVLWVRIWTMHLRMASSVRPVNEVRREGCYRLDGKEYRGVINHTDFDGHALMVPQKLERMIYRNGNDFAVYDPEYGADAVALDMCKVLLRWNPIESCDDEPWSDMDENSDESMEWYTLLARRCICMNASGFAAVLRESITENGHKVLAVDYLGTNLVCAFVGMRTANDEIQSMILMSRKGNSGVEASELLSVAEMVYDSFGGDQSNARPIYMHPDSQTPKSPCVHLTLTEGLPGVVYTTKRIADFVAQPIRELMRNAGNDYGEAYDLMEMKEDYHLDQTALQLAEVFRVEENLFDSEKDTEAMIHKGMIKEARMIAALRSFAWTLGALADQQRRPYDSYTYAELEQLGYFIERKAYRNFDYLSYFAGLTNHEDWHVFYVPDVYLKEEVEEDLRELCNKTERSGNVMSNGSLEGIRNSQIFNEVIRMNKESLTSLEALRYDLALLEPVMRTIHSRLSASRNRKKYLSGIMADVLAAWCALCVAAKEPFYSEEASVDYGLADPLARPYQRAAVCRGVSDVQNSGVQSSDAPVRRRRRPIN